MIPVQAKLIGIAACLVLAFVSGWMVKGWQTDAKTLQAYSDAVDRGNAMGEKLEQSLAKLEANKFIVKSEVRREIEKPVYSECIVPVSGVRLWNKSANGDTGEP